jgi:hypothetical protein
MANEFEPLIAALTKEVERLEQIAARFKKSNSIHFKATQSIVDSVKKQIERMKAGHI